MDIKHHNESDPRQNKKFYNYDYESLRVWSDFKAKFRRKAKRPMFPEEALLRKNYLVAIYAVTITIGFHFAIKDLLIESNRKSNEKDYLRYASDGSVIKIKNLQIEKVIDFKDTDYDGIVDKKTMLDMTTFD